jgi:hypothetical protein
MTTTLKLDIWPILSSIIWILFVIFVCTVSSDSDFAKPTFFFILFCGFLSTIYGFHKNLLINLILTFYSLSLILLLFFHQFSVLNLILLTSLLIVSLLFVKDKNTS